MRFCVIARNLLGYLALKTEYDLGERVVVRLGRGDLRDRRQPEEIARGRYVNLAESLAERCLELTNQLIARQSRCPSLRLLTRGQTDELLQVARRAIVRALNRNRRPLWRSIVRSAVLVSQNHCRAPSDVRWSLLLLLKNPINALSSY